jgi:hypothetical protein
VIRWERTGWWLARVQRETAAKSALAGMAGAHAVAAVVEELAHQQRRRARPALNEGALLRGELGLDGFEQVAIEDRLMLSRAHVTAIEDLADVEAVVQQIGEGTPRERDAADGAAIRKPAQVAVITGRPGVIRHAVWLYTPTPADRIGSRLNARHGITLLFTVAVGDQLEGRISPCTNSDCANPEIDELAHHFSGRWVNLPVSWLYQKFDWENKDNGYDVCQKQERDHHERSWPPQLPIKDCPRDEA